MFFDIFDFADYVFAVLNYLFGWENLPDAKHVESNLLRTYFGEKKMRKTLNIPLGMVYGSRVDCRMCATLGISGIFSMFIKGGKMKQLD